MADFVVERRNVDFHVVAETLQVCIKGSFI